MGVSYSGTIPAPWLARAVYSFNPVNQNFIASQCARPIQSAVKEGTLAEIKRASTLGKNYTLNRTPGGNYQRGQVVAGGTDYECLGYGYEHNVPAENQALYSNLFNAMVVAGQVVKGELYTGREKRMADLLFSSTWTGGGASLYTDVSTDWDDATATIIADVTAAKEYVRANTGLEANAMILGQKQYNNCLWKNTQIRALLSGINIAGEAVLNTSFLANVLGLKYIIVGGAVYDSGNEGDTNPTITDIWSDDYAMICRVAETSNPAEPCVSRIITWSGMGAGTEVMFSTYDEPQTKSTVVQGDLYEDEIVVDSSFGHLLKIDT